MRAGSYYKRTMPRQFTLTIAQSIFDKLCSAKIWDDFGFGFKSLAGKRLGKGSRHGFLLR
jgi:hypothetical protein